MGTMEPQHALSPSSDMTTYPQDFRTDTNLPQQSGLSVATPETTQTTVSGEEESGPKSICKLTQGPLLLTKINFDPSMDN